MKARDVATIAFRVLAVWITVSAVTSLIDLIFNWKTVWAQMAGAFSGVTNPPTQRELFLMSASAFVGRGLTGVAVWWLAPLFARASAPSQTVATKLTREDLYAAASFVVGLYLVALSAPWLAFEVYSATRPGFPAYPETHQQIPFLLAQLLLGLAFIRNRWLVNLTSGDTHGSCL
jgi:hypothetical protein